MQRLEMDPAEMGCNPSWILVKPYRSYDGNVVEYILGDSLEEDTDATKIFIDATYDEAQHATIRCKVVAVCDRLMPMDVTFPHMRWETDLELAPGDDVVTDYLPMLASLGRTQDNAKTEENGRAVIINGEVYVFVHYGSCVARIRNEEIYPLNGYCLIERLKIKMREHRFAMTEHTIGQNSRKYGRVYRTGCLNRRNLDDPDWTSDEGIGVKEGDIVMWNPKRFPDVPVTRGINHDNLFPKDMDVCRMQQHNMLAVVSEQPLEYLT